MSAIAVRIETQGGTYTNIPGETAGVFDVTVVAGLFDPGHAEVGEHDGRPTVKCNQGACISLKEYERNIPQGPDDYNVIGIKGMYTDNPVSDQEAPESVVALLSTDHQKKIFTFMGTKATQTAIDQLASTESTRALYVKAAVAIAVNYAQRTVPG